MKQTVCVDLDGVLARFDEWHGVDYFGDVIPGAKEFLESLSKTYEIIIYTCRCTEGISGIEKSNLLRNRVRDWLDENELKYDEIYTGQGKPIAKAYIDDKGINCNPTQDSMAFEKVLLMLGSMDEIV